MVVWVVVGGQFALAVKNWQEPFVHKWDTPLKVTEWIDKCAMNFIHQQRALWQTHFLLEHSQSTDTQLSNGTRHCSPVEQECDSFVELGVVCKNYEDLYNDCALSTNMQFTTQMPIATSLEGI